MNDHDLDDLDALDLDDDLDEPGAIWREVGAANGPVEQPDNRAVFGAGWNPE